MNKKYIPANSYDMVFERMLRERDKKTFILSDGTFKKLIDMTDEELSWAHDCYLTYEIKMKQGDIHAYTAYKKIENDIEKLNYDKK